MNRGSQEAFYSPLAGLFSDHHLTHLNAENQIQRRQIDTMLAIS